MEIAPLGTAASPRTTELFMLIVAVGENPNSTFTDWLRPPLVALPPSDIGPEFTIGIVNTP
jgi:hypothetical protein